MKKLTTSKLTNGVKTSLATGMAALLLIGSSAALAAGPGDKHVRAIKHHNSAKHTASGKHNSGKHNSGKHNYGKHNYGKGKHDSGRRHHGERDKGHHDYRPQAYRHHFNHSYRHSYRYPAWRYDSHYGGRRHYKSWHNLRQHHYGAVLGAALVGSVLRHSLYHRHDGNVCYDRHENDYGRQSYSSEAVGCHRIERLPDGSERRVEVPMSQCY